MLLTLCYAEDTASVLREDLYNICMKKDNMFLSKKKLTKLLNKEFRESILCEYHTDKYQINGYAKYVVDSQIAARVNDLKDSKDSFYGFSPIGFICAVKKDGSIEKKLLEMNVVNHFLHEYKGQYAIDVVKCILLLWLQQDKEIESFDYMKIDAELARIEQEYLAKEKVKQLVAKKTAELSSNAVSSEILSTTEGVQQ